MKKIVLFSIIIMTFYTSHAQLAVQQDGSVLIGSNTTTSAKLNILAYQTNVLACRVGTSVGIAPVLEGSNYIACPKWAMGVRGASYGTEGAINCGIWGTAASTSSNKIYGVFGSINADRGAAIYGQAFSWTSSSGVELTAPYAGYFQGNVHVQGVLSSSGAMLTVMPGSTEIQSESISSSKDESQWVTRQLQSLDVQRYIHTAPFQSSAEKTISDDDYAGMDTMEVESIKKNLREGKKDKDVIATQIYSKQHYSLNIEQLEAIFPDLVYENEDGQKSINYVELVPILVQSIKELKTEVEELKSGEEKKAKENKIMTSDIGKNDKQSTLLFLGQNKPNPFSNTSSVEVFIPEDIQNAFIYVYDLQGKKVEQVDISVRGRHNIQLNSSKLTDGMYLYSLITDGKIVETRRMIVEK